MLNLPDGAPCLAWIRQVLATSEEEAERREALRELSCFDASVAAPVLIEALSRPPCRHDDVASALKDLGAEAEVSRCWVLEILRDPETDALVLSELLGVLEHCNFRWEEIRDSVLPLLKHEWDLVRARAVTLLGRHLVDHPDSPDFPEWRSALQQDEERLFIAAVLSVSGPKLPPAVITVLIETMESEGEYFRDEILNVLQRVEGPNPLIAAAMERILHCRGESEWGSPMRWFARNGGTIYHEILVQAAMRKLEAEYDSRHSCLVIGRLFHWALGREETGVLRRVKTETYRRLLESRDGRLRLVAAWELLLLDENSEEARQVVREWLDQVERLEPEKAFLLRMMGPLARGPSSTLHNIAWGGLFFKVPGRYKSATAARILTYLGKRGWTDRGLGSDPAMQSS